MNRFLRGAVLLAVTAALGACGTEPDQFKDGTPTKIVASPSTVLVAQADSQAVIIRTVDEQGTSLISPVTVTTVGDGITVVPDSAFKPIYNSGDSLVYNPNATELRFFVKASEDANQLLPWSFDVSSGDLTLTVPVTIFPKQVQDIAISNQTPALAEVITLTPNAGIHFTDSSKVTFGIASPRIVEIAPDGSSMTIVVGPNQVGPATISNVGVSYNPNLAFTVNSALTVTGVKVDTFFVTVDDATPAANQPVTVTLSGNTPPELFKWEFGTTSFLNGSLGAVLLDVSADGQTAHILPEPGADDQLFANAGLIDDFEQTLPTNVKLTVDTLTPIAGTNAFASAPALVAPGVDSAIALWNRAPFGFSDAGNFGPGGVHLYKLTVNNDAEFNFTLDNISKGADLGVYLYDAAFDLTGDAVDGAGSGAGANGESGDIELAAGTYYIGVVWFQYSTSPTAPDRYRLIVTGNEP